MNGTEMVYMLLIFIAAAALLTALGSVLYYRNLMSRMSKMLRRYQEQQWIQNEMEDTRESKLESQLHRLLRQSSAQREQAQRDRESLASLLSDLSHQLKTPLANVAMDAELLQDEKITERERQGFQAHIGEQVQKMQWLVSTLVKASRLEHGIIHFEAKMQSIRPTLAMSVSSVYMQAQEKEISIILESDEDRELFHNCKWTAEAITNILENAIKYSPRGSSVRIETEPLATYTKINIYDQGPGISAEEYNQIFQRFYRGNVSDETEGTGLGLYLTQVILSQEKGYAIVSANPEGGSCFSVFLLNQPVYEGV